MLSMKALIEARFSGVIGVTGVTGAAGIFGMSAVRANRAWIVPLPNGMA